LDLKNEIVKKFQFLGNKLDTHIYRVMLIGDFNFPGFDFERGVSLDNCNFILNLGGKLFIHACVSLA
jgi:hypothetical protein